MAFTTSLLLVASLVLFLSLLLPLPHLVKADQPQSTITGAQSPSPTTTIDCGAACAARCQLSSRPNLCRRACGTCCFRCQCVPPGTSGNYDSCPCYATMTTHGNQHKCP